MAKVLPNSVIQSIYKAAVAVRLDRNALLAGLPITFTCTLLQAEQPGAQLLTDLLRLNQVDRLEDGTVPLREWLETAELLAGPQAEAKMFREALNQLIETKQASAASPQAEPRTADTRAREQALHRLLQAMFSADELRRFIRYLRDGRELEGALPGSSAPPVKVVEAVVEGLVSRDAIDGEFFDGLIRERPRRREEIDQIRRMFLG